MKLKKLARLYALYHLCIRWHSGQWSRGYKISCQIQQCFLRLSGKMFYPTLSNKSYNFRLMVQKEYRKFYKLKHTL